MFSYLHISSQLNQRKLFLRQNSRSLVTRYKHCYHQKDKCKTSMRLSNQKMRNRTTMTKKRKMKKVGKRKNKRRKSMIHLMKTQASQYCLISDKSELFHPKAISIVSQMTSSLFVSSMLLHLLRSEHMQRTQWM